MAVMTGFETDLRQKIIGNESHVFVQAHSGGLKDWRGVAQRIGQIPGVYAVNSSISHQVIVRTGGRTHGILLVGVAPNSPLADQLRKESGTNDLFSPPVPLDGDSDTSEVPGILIGRSLSRSLYAAPGDSISVVSPEYSVASRNLVPKFGRFVVSATYSAKVREKESAAGYIDIEAARRFFNMGDAVTGLDIRLTNIDDAPRVSAEITQSLLKNTPGIEVTDWTTRNKPLREAMSLLSKVYFFVLLLITVMASFSIVTTLVMVIVEKRRDIAVLKTLGASTRTVSSIFRIQGAVIGGLGTLLGTLVGYAGCIGLKTFRYPLDERIFGMESLPIQINFFNFFCVGAAAFLICSLATLYPARRASRSHPADALRED